MNNHWLAADWPAPENIRAGTTLRTGGFSQGAYYSLNPAAHVGDNPALVNANRLRIEQLLQLPNQPAWLEQRHSAWVINAGEDNRMQQADAGFSAQQGIVCAVLTADCLPVLFCNPGGTHVAAAHAGWRGLLSGIIENTVEALRQDDLLAWLGPAIGPDCFEVGNEVRIAYVNKAAEFAAAFQQINEQKWLADIYRLARITLNKVGVHKIYGGGFCTVTDKHRFYSHRRDGITGRMASLIWRT